jgi:DNA-directed RNA polymerase specialized sigma24 family protein
MRASSFTLLLFLLSFITKFINKLPSVEVTNRTERKFWVGNKPLSMTNSNRFERERHQLIQRMLSQIQASRDLEQKEIGINQVVMLILRSRPLCRRFNGTPLTGVYQEIYEQAKDQLINHFYQYLIRDNLAINYQELAALEALSPSYLYRLQTRVFQQLLDDTQLKKMGLTAQSYLANSELRSYALTELIKAIQLSGKLCRPHTQKFSSNLYQTLYEDALTETFSYICLNIDLYDPYRGGQKFMTWVNFKLDKTILKCYERYKKYTQYELYSFQDLEQIRQPSTTVDLAQILRDYLNQDPEQKFSTVHIRNRPDANFSKIALAKFSGQSWETISQQLGIPVPTLSSFYNRWCHRFLPLLATELKKYL